MTRTVAVVAALLALGVAACNSTPADTASPPATVTFNEHVAPILFEHCGSCHRPVEPPVAGRAVDPKDPLCIAGAPFSLVEFQSAHDHAREIAAATERRAMPPWLPEPGHGAFLNERRLSDAEIATIRRWADQGAREGDPSAAPEPPAWPSGWQLGQPDLVLQLPEEYALQPGAGDVFRNFIVPVEVPAARFVRAVEFRADNPGVLHHASVGLDASRASRKLDREDRGPGFATMPDDVVQNVYGWSPGKVPVLEPADTAWTLHPGSDLVVQLHMVPGARSERVQPALGLFFSDTPPTRTPIVVKLESKTIDIPAGDAAYVVEDSYVLPADVDAVSVYPHAHALATEMKGTATLPDGSIRPLIWIKQWDVRWQDQYRYADPVYLPKGTTVAMRFTYDNSESNPNNRQRAPRRVRWGPASTDEMGALWLEVVPRRPEDAGLLTADYYRRALRTDIARAEMLVRSDAADPAARNLLAMKYLQAGRLDDAHAQLREALRLAPEGAEAHSNMGTVLQFQGRLADATVHLREAVRLDPDDDRIRANLANALHGGGQTAEAERELRRAIALNPENGDAHFNLAMLVGPQNRLDEAVVHLRRALEINPQNGEAHRNLAVALGLQGNVDAAIPHARTALRLMPASLETRQHLDRLLAASSRRR